MFATNLEAAGDVVDRDVMGLLAKRLKRGRPLADDEQSRLAACWTAWPPPSEPPPPYS